MIYFYLFLIFLIIICIKIFNDSKIIVLIVPFFLLAMINNFNFKVTVLKYIDIFDQEIINDNFILLIIAIGLIYVISDLLIMLGITTLLDKVLFKLNNNVLIIFVHIVSIFKDNIDLRNSNIVNKFISIYDKSTNVNVYLNPFSSFMLTFYAFTILVDYDNKLFSFFYISNFFIIVWFLKKLLNYYLFEKNLVIEEKDIIIYDIYPFLNALLVRLSIYLVSIIGIKFVFNIEFFLLLFLITVIIFIDVFVCCIHFSATSKSIEETQIYQTLNDTVFKLINPVFDFISCIMFIVIFSTYLNEKVFITNVSIDINTVIVVGIIVILTLILNNNLYMLTFLFPILIVMSSQFILTKDILICISFLISLIFYISYVFVDLKAKFNFDDLFYILSIFVIYFVYYTTSNLLLCYLMIFLYISFLYFKYKFRALK